MKKQDVFMTVLSAMFVVLIIIGSYISIKIPISPVPIVLQNMFVFLAALLLGKKWGTLTISTYLILGLVGLPVFANAKSQAALFGPTGGYLIAYIPAVFISGLIAEQKNNSSLYNTIAVFTAIIIIYLIGVPWLKTVNNIPLKQALYWGFIPFILWDIIKGISVIMLVKIIKPIIDSVIDE